MPPFRFYSKVGCPFCDALENDLKKYKLEYEKIIPGKDEIAKLKVSTKMNTFPMLFIGNELIGGYNDFEKLVMTNSLEEKLKANNFFDIKVPFTF